MSGTQCAVFVPSTHRTIISCHVISTSSQRLFFILLCEDYAIPTGQKKEVSLYTHQEKKLSWMVLVCPTVFYRFFPFIFLFVKESCSSLRAKPAYPSPAYVCVFNERETRCGRANGDVTSAFVCSKETSERDKRVNVHWCVTGQKRKRKMAQEQDTTAMFHYACVYKWSMHIGGNGCSPWELMRCFSLPFLSFSTQHFFFSLPSVCFMYFAVHITPWTMVHALYTYFILLA